MQAYDISMLCMYMHVLNQITDFHETVCEWYATEGHPTLYYWFPTLHNTNMAGKQSCEGKVTLAPLNIGSWNYIL